MTATATKPTESNRSNPGLLNRKIALNYRRNQQQDNTEKLDAIAQSFSYDACKDRYWQGEKFSLLYGTPLWAQASAAQRLTLNHLYWVAYYSQIISAEIATIFFNQTSAAGLYAHEGFRTICDMLDLESAQERAHITAFQTIARRTEAALFGKSLFTYPMRGPFTETMLFANTNWLKQKWKQLQLNAFGLVSANNTFLACQYFTVRGLRTLNGKLVQHQLSHDCVQNTEGIENAPIPSQVSHYHFLDESFHFNSSTLISHDVINELAPPTKFEQQIANLGIRGCQQDHANFSVVINGIFWHDPGLYETVYQLLKSPIFAFSQAEAADMMRQCFTQESAGLHESYQTHHEAMSAYRAYLEPLSYVWPSNREMSIMARAEIERYLKIQNRALPRFLAKKGALS